MSTFFTSAFFGKVPLISKEKVCHFIATQYDMHYVSFMLSYATFDVSFMLSYTNFDVSFMLSYATF